VIRAIRPTTAGREARAVQRHRRDFRPETRSPAGPGIERDGTAWPPVRVDGQQIAVDLRTPATARTTD
jgi:hypothetical protein